MEIIQPLFKCSKIVPDNPFKSLSHPINYTGSAEGNTEDRGREGRIEGMGVTAVHPMPTVSCRRETRVTEIPNE